MPTVPGWRFLSFCFCVTFSSMVFFSVGLCVISWLIWDRYGTRALACFVCSFLKTNTRRREWTRKSRPKTIGNGDDANRSAQSEKFCSAIKMAIKHRFYDITREFLLRFFKFLFARSNASSLTHGISLTSWTLCAALGSLLLASSGPRSSLAPRVRGVLRQTHRPDEA